MRSFQLYHVLLVRAYHSVAARTSQIELPLDCARLRQYISSSRDRLFDATFSTDTCSCRTLLFSQIISLSAKNLALYDVRYLFAIDQSLSLQICLIKV